MYEHEKQTCNKHRFWYTLILYKGRKANTRLEDIGQDVDRHRTTHTPALPEVTSLLFLTVLTHMCHTAVHTSTCCEGGNFRVKNTDASWSRQREIWRWVTDIIPLKVYAQQWLLYRIQVYVFLVVLVCYMFTSMDEASEVEEEAAEAREVGTCTSQTSRVCHLNSNLRLPCLRKFHVEKKRRNKGG